MKEQERIIFKISILYALMMLVGVYFTGKIVYLQFFAKDEDGVQYSKLAARTTFGKKSIYPRRGSILAHNGVPLAVSVPSYKLYMDFLAGGLTEKVFQENVGPLSVSMAGYFKDKSAADYKTNLQNERKKALRLQQVLERRYKTPSYNKRITSTELDIFQLEQVKKFPLYKGRAASKSGLVVEEGSRREYLYGGMGYRTIGYLGKGGNSVGIESAYDKYLAGTSSERTFQVTAKGDTTWQEMDKNVVQKDGDDVISTLDVDFQDVTETALLRSIALSNDLFNYGTAIVMEVSTGQIRAMVNLQKQPNGSFRETMNYAISEGTDPGSTFKIASLMATLETGKIELDDLIDCGEQKAWKDPQSKHIFREAGSRGYGKITVQNLIEKSSNIGTAKMVLQVFQGKEDKFIDQLYKMNLGKSLKFDLQGEAKPLIKHPKDKKNWNKATMPQIAIGYEMQMAPIHTLTFYNAIANNGKMMKPTIVKGIKYNGGSEELFDPVVLNSSICSKKTLEKIQTVLTGIVRRGTAVRINGTEYGIAGKTGTAQIAFKSKSGRMVYKEGGMKRHQASFCGYFPDKNPKYSCIVVLYTGKIPEGANFYGATWAAPVFKEIADKIYAMSPAWHAPVNEKATSLEELSKPPIKATTGKGLSLMLGKLNLDSERKIKHDDWLSTTYDEGKMVVQKLDIAKNMVPSVKNMGLRDAIYLLESMGMRVSFSGKGSVYKQSPEAGEPLKKGQTVFIELS